MLVMMVHATDTNDVQVWTMVDGVTRQLQTLLTRSGSYVERYAGGVGVTCLFRGGERAVTVELAKPLVARTAVVLLEVHGAEELVALLQHGVSFRQIRPSSQCSRRDQC